MIYVVTILSERSTADVTAGAPVVIGDVAVDETVTPAAADEYPGTFVGAGPAGDEYPGRTVAAELAVTGLPGTMLPPPAVFTGSTVCPALELGDAPPPTPGAEGDPPAL